MCRHSRKAEQGGLTILVAIILLSVATVAAIGLSRDSIREALITGNEGTGRKAYEMADSGLDWVVTWGSPYVVLQSDAAKDVAEKSLLTGMSNLLDAIDNESLRGSYMDATGTLNLKLLGSTTGGSMVPKTTTWLQGSAVKPSFDVEVRYLGPYELANTGRGPLIKNTRSLWLVRSSGFATVGTMPFVSRREATVDYIN